MAARQSDWPAAAAWARSGVMALSGWPDGPPVLPPAHLPGRLDDVVSEIAERTARRGRRVTVSWGPALAGRAALLGFGRRGQISPNGSCRLLPAADGWVALNLPRPDDLDLIPALAGLDTGNPWADAGRAARSRGAVEFVAAARGLGLAAALCPNSGPGAPAGSSGPGGSAAVTPRGAQRSGVGPGSWTVVDLSSLWAGPVAARVLAAAGAEVIKLESVTRPDGARSSPRFYQWIHAAGESVKNIDLRGRTGQQRAAALIERADVVIEGSRPRALEQLGLGPSDRAAPTGQVWLSITGYGRAAPGREWVAFGDDAAVAGGLTGWDGDRRPLFLGDAIADPLTGLVGALLVLRAQDDGGGRLIDLALSRVAAAMAGASDPSSDGAAAPIVVERSADETWRVRAGALVEPVRPRPPSLEWIRAG